MAKYFESLVRNDPFFEIPAQRHLGLVVFRLKVMPSSMAVNDVIGDHSLSWKHKCWTSGVAYRDEIQTSLLFILQTGS